MKFYIHESPNVNITRISVVENNTRFIHFVFYESKSGVYKSEVWLKKGDITKIDDFFNYYRQLYINNKKLQKYIKLMVKTLFEENK